MQVHVAKHTFYTEWPKKNVYTLAAVRRLWQCLDADGGHFEHLHWIQNSRTSLISILLLYKYSSYDYRVIFFMSKCVYIFLGHSVYLGNKELYSIFKTCCIICVLFCTKCHLFHNFLLFYSDHAFFINHALKFRYKPSHLKVKVEILNSNKLI